MQGAMLVRNQVLQVCQSREKRLLTPPWMVESLHHKEFPVDGVVGLIQQRAAGWHLWVGEYRIPSRLLGLEPVTHPLTVPCSYGRRDVIGKVAQSLAQCHHPQACALATPMQQGVELRTQALAHWCLQANQLVGELVERVAQAVAQASPRLDSLYPRCQMTRPLTIVGK